MTKLKLLNEKPKDIEAYSVLASQFVTVFMTRWQTSDPKQIGVLLTMANLSDFDLNRSLTELKSIFEINFNGRCELSPSKNTWALKKNINPNVRRWFLLQSVSS